MTSTTSQPFKPFELIDKLTEHFSPQPPIQPNANLIRYAVVPNYAFMRVLRSTSPGGPFQELPLIDPVKVGGLYLHKNLVNGQTYYYRLEGISSSGAVSAPSDIFSGTPKAAPYQPIGSVTIQNGAAFVGTNQINLTLNYDATSLTVNGLQNNEASAMLVSNQPDFANASWQAYAQTLNWTLSPASNSRAVVYVKYRDAAGNESNPYFDDIIVKPLSALGRVYAQIMLKPRPVLAPFDFLMVTTITMPGVSIIILNDSRYGPAFTTLNGKGPLENLLPGNYNLQIDYPGYYPKILRGITVSGGSTAELGNLTLQLLHSLRLPQVTR